MRITLDFETRSACDLRKRGAWLYSLDSTTSVLCLAWAIDDAEPLIWHPAIGDLPEEGTGELCDLLDVIERAPADLIVEAHNAFFERCIWSHVCQEWPQVPEWAWRCSAAKAASYALPRDLDRACRALRLPMRKDDAGHKLMMKLAKPAKPTKKEPGRLWHEKAEELRRLFAYCVQDVRAERALSKALADLHPDELRIWRLDQEINARGMKVDGALIEGALRIAEETASLVEQHLQRVTDGAVEKASARPDMVAWLLAEGVDIPRKRPDDPSDDARTIDADAVKGLLAGDLPARAREALTWWQKAQKSSVKKYDAMLNRMAGDGRVRDVLRFHAASTGRWAGSGIQPHNFPRGYKKEMPKVCADIATGDRELVEMIWGDPMKTLANALRGAIVAPPGRVLNAADFSAIEARVLLWCADDQDGLDIFRKGLDIYKVMAASILGKTYEGITDDERQIYGKVPVLACGYQMGPDKLIAYGAKMGVNLSDELAKQLVTGYREQFVRVKRLWYDVEEAARNAVLGGQRGRPQHAGRCQYIVRGRFLYCRLPCGRRLAYLDPRIETRLIPRKATAEEKAKGIKPEPFEREVIVFHGVDQVTNQFVEQTTYGGKLVENIVQAISRDLLRDAMLRIADRAPQYEIMLHVHDEIVAESDADAGSLKDFEALCAELPEWAAGLPMGVEGFREPRYRKA